MHRVNKKSRSQRFVVASDCHPQTIALIKTRAEPLGLEIDVVDPETLGDCGEAFGMLAQYPGTWGDIRSLEAVTTSAHNRNTLVCVASDLLALTMIKPPGAQGVDVVVGKQSALWRAYGLRWASCSVFCNSRCLQALDPRSRYRRIY